jgi:hypothetical protein
VKFTCAVTATVVGFAHLHTTATPYKTSVLKRVSVKGLHEEGGFGWDVVEEVLRRYISSMHLDDKPRKLMLYAEVQGAMFERDWTGWLI